MPHETYKERTERYAAIAASRLDRHQYTRLTLPGSPLEAWRCKRPDTTNYAFDLVISRFGIASFGDTANLMFRVGASYGLPFLAGNDVEYYIHSKLDECCKKTELDDTTYQQALLQTITQWLADNDHEAPAQGEMDDDTYREILGDWLWEQYLASDVMADDHDTFYALHDALAHQHPNSADEAHETMAELASKLDESYDYDHSFTRPANHLIQDLYVLRHAAQQILKLKHPEPGSALGAYTSEGEPAYPAPKMPAYDETDPDQMRLPPGITCGDCVHIKRCKAIYGHTESDTRCDWSPSRFSPASKDQP